MFRLLVLLIFVSAAARAQTPNVPGPIAMPWQIAHEVGWTVQQPSVHFQNLVYAQRNIATQYGPAPHIVTIGVKSWWVSDWTIADVRPWNIPCDDDPAGAAKAVLLVGIFGITPSNPPMAADLQIFYRKLGDTTAIGPPSFAYIGQTTATTEGSRTNTPTMIALTDCKFEWAYSMSTPPGLWDAVPSYLINIGPQLWVR